MTEHQDDSAPPPDTSRDALALEYIDRLPFAPYEVQERALFTWFACRSGVLVCTPTGTGKTLIAEAAAFEALKTGKRIYYTTPLIALTEQKFVEMQEAAARWGFPPDRIGLVTGNRRVNPDAPVLVVVAEILLNRLLNSAAFDFSDVFAVVMDEFHSFSDPERGIVWEFTLALLPPHARLLLLSATVGNALPFLSWLKQSHRRDLDLVQGTERRVPLEFRWVPDMLLNELLEEMAGATRRAAGSGSENDDGRRTPALVFCFNRDECWQIAEELKGRALLADGQQKDLADELVRHDWSKGAGPKFKQILMRGVGVHHAGILPRHKRVVEALFQKKLLSVCVCTETLAAGINLPARSVVLTSLLKGKPGSQRLLDSSSAHQMFGRAGRPQYDARGFVFAVPHPDDVKILRWREKFDRIPADSKDPNLIKAKKALKKKEPTRSPERQYWNQQQFEKLQKSPPGDLASRGSLPWRFLAYLLTLSPDVERVRSLVRKRLMPPKNLEAAERHLDQMLLTLLRGGFVMLEPEPPAETPAESAARPAAPAEPEPPAKPSALQRLIDEITAGGGDGKKPGADASRPPGPARYRALLARPTERLPELFAFRSMNPLYGLFLLEHFDLADPHERMQMFESVLELPPALLRLVRTPSYHERPPGPLATGRVDEEIVQRGLLPVGDLYPEWDPDCPPEARKYAPALADKLHMLFRWRHPCVDDVRVQPVWVAGELTEFGGDFYHYVGSRDLVKQEGLVFRHLLRLILLLGEFGQLAPRNVDPIAWRDELRELAVKIAESCRAVDPSCTDSVLEHAGEDDLLRGEAETPSPLVGFLSASKKPDSRPSDPAAEFGSGLIDDD